MPVNSTIAIIGEEGDDLSGADALAKEAESESASASAGEAEKAAKQEESAKEEESKQKEAKSEEEDKPAAPKPRESDDSGSASKLASMDHLSASPIAKRIALERGIPLLQVKGSGPNGRIVKEDVEKFASGSGAAAAAATASTAAAGGSAPAYTDQPLSNMRRTIAKRLTESKSTVPHYYVTFDIEMDRVLQLREVFNRASAEAARGDEAKAKQAKLSVNDFIVKAAALALKQVPAANSAWHGEYIREYHTQDISMAVATPNGLITPIIRNCGAIGLTEIGKQSKELAKKARDGKLKPEEYQGGTTAVSNLGMYGINHFTAVINPPHASILAVGTSEERPVVRGGKIEIANIMSVTLSCDHRAIDGALGAELIGAFKQLIENPVMMMV